MMNLNKVVHLLKSTSSLYYSAACGRKTLSTFSNKYLAVICNAQIYNQHRHFRSQTTLHNNSENYGRIIYEATDNSKIIGLQTIATTGSIAIAVTYPKVLHVLSNSSIATVIMSMSMAFIFIQPIGIYWLIRGYVNKLYYNKDDDVYTAILPSWYVWPKKRLTFKSTDCKMTKSPRMFTSFLVKGKSLFINSDVMNYKDYMHMLRDSKEFDFENPNRQEDHLKSVLENLNKDKKEDENK